ncbi:group II intron maturase-specific domain-containing protein [Ensifer adhaerens]|uniref:group II intron maturase-specific domain-containing protein n=1 Tax=Ensifer adhaerens TaxID=106592 RepID=UPI0039C92C83
MLGGGRLWSSTTEPDDSQGVLRRSSTRSGKSSKATRASRIQKLNPVIRGWAMHHRHVVAKASFSSIDAHIWQMLWK